MPISSLVVLVLAPTLFCTAMAFFPGSAVTWHRPSPPRGTRWLPTEPVRRPLVRGFSLLELIVVLVVLGLLAALAIPTFQRTIGRTAQASVEATAEALGRNLQALAALDQTSPRTVDVDAAIAEMSGDFTFDASSYVTEGTVVVTRDTACATLTMDETLGSAPTVEACAATAGPSPLDPLDLARTLVFGSYTDGLDELVLPKPAPALFPDWTFDPDFQKLFDFEPWSVPEGTWLSLFADPAYTVPPKHVSLFGVAAGDCFQVLVNASNPFWVLPTNTVWVSNVPATGGECPDAYTWDDYLPGGVNAHLATTDVYDWSEL